VPAVLLRSSSPGLLLNGLPQIIGLPLVRPDEGDLAPDFAHSALKGVCVGFSVEDDDVNTTLAGLRARVELVRVSGRRESNVAGGQKEDHRLSALPRRKRRKLVRSTSGSAIIPDPDPNRTLQVERVKNRLN
jgi:hypothetical protein